MKPESIIIVFAENLRIGAKLTLSADAIEAAVSSSESRAILEKSFALLEQGKIASRKESSVADGTISLWFEPAAPGSADFPSAFAKSLEQQGAYAVPVTAEKAELLEFFDKTTMTAESRAKLIPELLALSEKDAHFLLEEKRLKG